LVKQGNYFEAAIAYERLYYFTHDYKLKNRYRFQKALCYKSIGDYQTAEKELNKINLFGLSADEKREITYQTILVSYLAEDYEQSNRAFLLLDTTNLDSLSKKTIYLVGTLNSIMLLDFKQSELFALQYARLTCQPEELSEVSKQIHGWYTKKQMPKIKNEKVFEWISIVPGMGQMYVGKPGEGLMNIGLNLAAFSFGVVQILNGCYFTGYFVGTLSINKFYFGGRTRAKNLFKETNQVRLNAYHNRMKEQMIMLVNQQK